MFCKRTSMGPLYPSNLLRSFFFISNKSDGIVQRSGRRPLTSRQRTSRAGPSNSRHVRARTAKVGDRLWRWCDRAQSCCKASQTKPKSSGTQRHSWTIALGVQQKLKFTSNSRFTLHVTQGHTTRGRYWRVGHGVHCGSPFARIPLLLLTTFLKSEVTIKSYQEVDLGKTYRFT